MALGKKILLVDDDLYMRHMVQTVLDSNDFDIYCAGDRISALFLLKSVNLDIVISDFHMPGIEGSELVQIARNNSPRLFIIGISGDDVEKEFLKAGADTFLKKPFSVDKLLSLITSE